MTKNLSSIWAIPPIDGITVETWGIFLNAIVDGIALQALLQKDFPVEKTYNELAQLLNGLTKLINQGDK